jgi:predicted short-subunit dehydrogenase-like oxidoreductase (DUF2520 family)
MTEAERSRFQGPIGLVGAGRLGSALATALATCGYRVELVASRGHLTAEALAVALGGEARATTPAAVVASCELVVLAVPDAAIKTVADGLNWRRGQAVVHCSGALDLGVLACVTAAGGLAGCLHPLQSFSPGSDASARFRGITCGVEGAAPLGGWLETMVRDLGAHPLRLEGVDRALYHAAAVLASNDAVALLTAAARVWAAAGLPVEAARGALAPLLLGAARNIEARPLELALTGPIARGDVDTVARHLAALAGAPDLRALYAALGRELLRLPLALDAAARARLEGLLA